MKKKSQSAMEFLITYMWGILLITFVIGILAFYGVFNFKGLVAKRCTGRPDLPCISLSSFSNGFTTNSFEVSQIAFQARNSMPGKIKLLELNTSGRFDNCDVIATGIEDQNGNNYRICEHPTIKSNEMFLIKVYCSNKLDKVMEEEIALDYEYLPTSLIHENFFLMKASNMKQNTSEITSRTYEDREEPCCELGLFGVNCYEDNDGDSYGAGSKVNFCTSDGLCPTDYVSNDDDCYDFNEYANPDQNDYFTSDRGDGDFDYNCNNNEDKDDKCKTCTSCESSRSCDGSCGYYGEEFLDYNCNTDIECGESADKCKIKYVWKADDIEAQCHEDYIAYQEEGSGSKSYCRPTGDHGPAGIEKVSKVSSSKTCGCN